MSYIRNTPYIFYLDIIGQKCIVQNMKTYIVFVDKQTYIGRYRYGQKTKRFEIVAPDICAASKMAIDKNGGGDVSMIWPKV